MEKLLSENLFNIKSISFCVYKCFISSRLLSNLGSLKSLAGLYLINPYTSQASRNDPFKTFKMFLKYVGAKSLSSTNSVIYEFNLALVIVESLYFPNLGIMCFSIMFLYA